MKLKDGDWYYDPNDTHYPYGVVGEREGEQVIIFEKTPQLALEAKKSGNVRGWLHIGEPMTHHLKKMKKEDIILLLL